MGDWKPVEVATFDAETKRLRDAMLHPMHRDQIPAPQNAPTTTPDEEWPPEKRQQVWQQSAEKGGYKNPQEAEKASVEYYRQQHAAKNKGKDAPPPDEELPEQPLPPDADAEPAQPETIKSAQNVDPRHAKLEIGRAHV